MKRRIAGSTLWVKLLPTALVWMGVPYMWAGQILAAVAGTVAGKQIRDGIAEQYWETPQHQAERMWTDLVWSNSRWLNPETPEQGIERLAGPHRVAAQTVPAGPFLPIPGGAR